MKKNTLMYAALGGVALAGAWWFLLRKKPSAKAVSGAVRGILAAGVLQRVGHTIKFNGTVSAASGDRLIDVWLEAATVSPDHTILSDTGAKDVQQVRLSTDSPSHDVALSAPLSSISGTGRVKAWLIYAEGAAGSRKQYTLVDSDNAGLDFGNL